jgi:hypothetical protein
MRSVSNGGFNELGLHKISATCDPANRASVAVLTKNGMHQEGVLRHHFMSGASGEIDSCSASLPDRFSSKFASHAGGCLPGIVGHLVQVPGDRYADSDEM